MRGIVLYLSKYGSTKQYATWIANELRLPLKPIQDISINDILSYDVLILGSYIHANKIGIGSYLKKNWTHLIKKHILLFSTSVETPNSPLIRQSYEDSFSLAQRRKIVFFPLPGRLIMSQLTYLDKILVQMAKGIHFKYDAVDQTKIKPLIEYYMQFREFVRNQNKNTGRKKQ